MLRRLPLLLGFMCCLACITTKLPGQATDSSDPVSKYALDLRVRKATEPGFTKETRKFGVEIYQEGKSGDGIYLGETGSIAVIPSRSFKLGQEKVKEPTWLNGLNLNVRPAGETSWSKGRKHGLEIFRDENAGMVVLTTEQGGISAVPPGGPTTDKGVPGKMGDPTWSHAMDLKVRKAGDVDWDKAVRFGVEVFRDEPNQQMVYVNESGRVAVVPRKGNAREESGKGPIWLHGMELSARKSKEKSFTAQTAKFGIEVYLDDTTGNLIYLGQNGAMAVVPGKAITSATAGGNKNPAHLRGLDMTVRRAGQKNFEADSPSFGVELYTDDNNQNTVYITETGELAVIAPRAIP